MFKNYWLLTYEKLSRYRHVWKRLQNNTCMCIQFKLYTLIWKINEIWQSFQEKPVFWKYAKKVKSASNGVMSKTFIFCNTYSQWCTVRHCRYMCNTWCNIHVLNIFNSAIHHAFVCQTNTWLSNPNKPVNVKNLESPMFKATVFCHLFSVDPHVLQKLHQGCKT